MLQLVEDADLILEGTDNFEIRYLIHEGAVKLGKPWVYGGCIGSHGQTMTILPGQTPCLRCVFEAAPAPGEAGTCETAGVLSPIVNIVASFQAAEAFKILTGQHEQINRDLIYVDVWDNVQRRIKIAPLLGKVDCPCCGRRRFEWLDGDMGSHTTSLCGRNAVQVAHRTASRLNFAAFGHQLSQLGDVTAEAGLDFVHDAGPVGTYFMPQIIGSGAALFDFNNDGLLDILLLQGAGPKSGSKNRLFQQMPGGKFKDVSSGCGLDFAGF